MHRFSKRGPCVLPQVSATLLVVMLACVGAANALDGVEIPKPANGGTSVLDGIGTDISSQAALHMKDAALLTQDSLTAFLEKLVAALAAGGKSKASWQTAYPYAYALPEYLRQQHKDSVLQLVRQLASGSRVPEADKKLREAATQLDPTAFVQWAKKAALPAAKVKSLSTLPTPPKARRTPKRSPSPSKKKPAPKPPKTPYKLISNPVDQFNDWVNRMHSLGGSIKLLATDINPKPPKSTNPNLNVGRKGFKPRKIGLVFHMFLFQDKKGYLYPPQAYWDGSAPARRFIRVVNQLYRYSGTNIQFYLKEYRVNTKKYPYLKYKSLSDWQMCALYLAPCTCKLAAKHNVNPSKYINIYVMGSNNYYTPLKAREDPFGYNGYTAALPELIDTCGKNPGEFSPWNTPRSLAKQHIWLLWDRMDPLLENSRFSFEVGPTTLAHELGHVLGLKHTFSDEGVCSDTDLVVDTSVESGNLSDLQYLQLGMLCDDLIKYGLDEYAVEALDSCPKKPYPDNVFNIMSYTPANCKFYFTRGQVWRMQGIMDKHLKGYGK